MDSLIDLEEKVVAGQAFTRADAERVRGCSDLLTVGMLGDMGRKALHGDRVTFVRVREVGAAQDSASGGDAGEVRLVGAVASIDDALARVRETARWTQGVPLTGFSLRDLVHLVGGDHMALVELARALKHEGLEAVAEVPLDELGDTENAIEVVRGVLHGGLAAWRATVSRASFDERLDLIERAVIVHQATGAFKAFAPLPRHDSGDQPSTGYDDVRTIGIARLMCRNIPSIQVDWPLYGPKLAQVAIAYGADDIDGVSVVTQAELGHRRSPREEIERHVRMAFAEPMERDGRFAMQA